MATRTPRASSPDLVFIVLLALLIVFGFVMLTSASSDMAKARFGDSLYFLKHQLLFGFGTGLLGFFIGMMVYYRRWEKWAPWLFAASLLLLILVFSPLGFGTKGSERWLSVGPITFQPGEVLKLTFFLFLAAWLGKNAARVKSLKNGLIPFLLILGLTAGLLFIQPATSIAVIILGAAFAVYFIAGAKWWYIAVAILVGVGVVAALIYVTPYRSERFTSFLHPETDTLGKSYQINQILMAIGSGGATGVGFGKSTTKLKTLPEPIGDSIFAVIGEELGFTGTVALVLLFLFLLLTGLRIASHAPDVFGRLFVTGFVSLVGIQTFINIAAMTKIIPITGVPLPFVSYGGTALTIFLTMAGIVVNISKYRTRT
ncbi:MAG: putative peptidoglycan glycosyltransferase FtsW [Patescibacteria group bacterium]